MGETINLSSLKYDEFLALLRKEARVTHDVIEDHSLWPHSKDTPGPTGRNLAEEREYFNRLIAEAMRREISIEDLIEKFHLPETLVLNAITSESH